MERREAEAIYDLGREAVVEFLLRMDRQIERLTARVDKLERELANRTSVDLRRQSALADRAAVMPAGQRGQQVALGLVETDQAAAV